MLFFILSFITVFCCGSKELRYSPLFNKTMTTPLFNKTMRTPGKRLSNSGSSPRTATSQCSILTPQMPCQSHQSDDYELLGSSFRMESPRSSNASRLLIPQDTTSDTGEDALITPKKCGPTIPEDSDTINDIYGQEFDLNVDSTPKTASCGLSDVASLEHDGEIAQQLMEPLLI
eukprot:UN00952